MISSPLPSSLNHKMSVQEVQITTPAEDDDFLFAMEIASISALPFVTKTIIELGIIDAVAASPLSPSEVASRISSRNPDAPALLDRMSRLLASYSILSCSLHEEDGTFKTLYGLGPKGKFFLRRDTGSVSPLLLYLQHKRVVDGWSHLKDVILEGGIPFNRANGMTLFESHDKDTKFGEVFNSAMRGPTSIIIRKLVDGYPGFLDINTLVDVGGGVGSTLQIILEKHPNIKGINYDLPHVIKNAPAHPRIKHVSGNMFESIPKADAIFMKWIVHAEDDANCAKLMKNCWDALPEHGKVLIVDAVVPEQPNSDIVAWNSFLPDMIMLNVAPGKGRDRSMKEFEAIAAQAGFHPPKVVWRAYNSWVIEFEKM
ncbi:hypothetical protein MLD38_020413 [Melastoma candidum]|uniref:Uncharacterized protein n=1 Tax=Melastoma candidum TaxID=119954 RepID=A0ACB9QEP9_9MYRT|nr:hypothetical protein MLD38_020413 [Melastoma candidum]